MQREIATQLLETAILQTPVDAAGGHCYQISTAMQVCLTASLGGVRLSNTWSIYRKGVHIDGKLSLIHHRPAHLEGALTQRDAKCSASALR